MRDDVCLGVSVRDHHRPGLVLNGGEPGRELGPAADEPFGGELLRFATHSEVQSVATRKTTSFWWCEPARRVRESNSTSPPASDSSRASSAFLPSFWSSQLGCVRRIRPKTSTPRSAISARASPTDVQVRQEVPPCRPGNR